jgi:hypothetical protein
MHELIEAYEEYIEWLRLSEATMLPFLYTHGYSCPPDIIKRGEDLRAKIEDRKVLMVELASKVKYG